MAYKCSFLDNEEYTAQDVNDIFARITSGGVLFADTGYTMGDLNAAAGSVATEGVTRDPDSCRVVKENDRYKISKGACIMNDGSAIIFDANGQEIDVVEGQLNYVYLMRNSVGNTIDVIVSTYPGEAESIPLAEIDKKGIIHDRRVYARAKVDICSQGYLRNFTVNFTQCTSSKSETVTVDFGDGAFSYIIMWDGERVSSGGSTQARVANLRNLMPLIEGETVNLSIGKYIGDHAEYVSLEKDGQNLNICLLDPLSSAEYTINMAVI